MSQLDIVIPVYNEGENLLRVLNLFGEFVKTPFRVLVCYDHDDDTSLALLKAHPIAKVQVALVKNRGRGPHGAVLSGFAASNAPAVLVYPADDDYNASIIDLMVAAFDAGSDVVVASRFMPGGCMEGCPWLKGILVRASSFTLSKLARLPARDASNGLRLFSRRLLGRTRIESSRGFVYSIELLVKCHRLRWKITETPARWHQRTKGESRFRVLRWLPAYLRWYGYAFATTYLRRGPGTVPGPEPTQS